MNIVYYNIFINLLVNHENDDIRQIWSIFFNFRSSQNSYFVQIFFSRYKKSNFFVKVILQNGKQKSRTKSVLLDQ